MQLYLEEMRTNILAEQKLENNNENIEQELKPSLFQNKMNELLNELDEHIENIGGDYGPKVTEELENRLIYVVNTFNEEVNDIFKSSFNKWRVTDSQLRDFMHNKIQITPNKIANKKNKSKTPKFIKNSN